MSSLDTRFTPTGPAWAFVVTDGATNGITYTQGDHPNAVLVSNWPTSPGAITPVAVWVGEDNTGPYAEWPTDIHPGVGAIVLTNQCAVIAVNTQAFSDPAVLYTATAAGPDTASGGTVVTFTSGSLS